jgi:hypothetical protein
MPEIIADAGDPAANSYLTLEEADELMDSVLEWKAWADFEDDDRARILISGSRLIDQYKPWGPKSDPEQRMAFPTDKDPDGSGGFKVFDEVKNALIEYCRHMSRGDLLELKRLQAEGVTNSSTLGQSTTLSEDRSELPAGARRELDKAWTRHNSPQGGNGYPYEEKDCGSIFG